MTIKENETLKTGDAVLSELGAGLARRRIAQHLTQAQLAEQAGIGKRTLERLESGGSIQVAGLVRVLRILGLQRELLALVAPAGPRPMDLLKLKGRERQRVSSAEMELHDGKTAWTWGDDT